MTARFINALFLIIFFTRNDDPAFFKPDNMLHRHPATGKSRLRHDTPHSSFATNDTRSNNFATHYLSENNYACGIIIAQEDDI